MLTQIGYAMGLVCIVPLGDIIERRRLIMTMLFCSAIALLLLSFATNIWWLLISSLIVGLTSITPRLIVTIAAHLAKPLERSKVIGNVMSGLLIGILLSRVRVNDEEYIINKGESIKFRYSTRREKEMVKFVNYSPPKRWELLGQYY